MKSVNYSILKGPSEGRYRQGNITISLRPSEEKLTPSSIESKSTFKRQSKKPKPLSIFKTFPFFKSPVGGANDGTESKKSFVCHRPKVRTSCLSVARCDLSSDLLIQKHGCVSQAELGASELWPQDIHSRRSKRALQKNCAQIVANKKTPPRPFSDSQGECQTSNKKNVTVINVRTEEISRPKESSRDPKPAQRPTQRSKSVKSVDKTLKKVMGVQEPLEDDIKKHYLPLRKIPKMHKVQSTAPASPKGLAEALRKRVCSSQSVQAPQRRKITASASNSGSNRAPSLAQWASINHETYAKIAQDNSLDAPEKIHLILGLLEDASANEITPANASSDAKRREEDKTPNEKNILEAIKEDEKEDDEFEMTLRQSINKKQLSRNCSERKRSRVFFLGRATHDRKQLII